jgi:hypothetical protein
MNFWLAFATTFIQSSGESIFIYFSLSTVSKASWSWGNTLSLVITSGHSAYVSVTRNKILSKGDITHLQLTTKWSFNMTYIFWASVYKNQEHSNYILYRNPPMTIHTHYEVPSVILRMWLWALVKCLISSADNMNLCLCIMQAADNFITLLCYSFC